MVTSIETFKQTSNEPYIRHHYRLTTTDGKVYEFDNYADLMHQWLSLPNTAESIIEVLDVRKGFK